MQLIKLGKHDARIRRKGERPLLRLGERDESYTAKAELVTSYSYTQLVTFLNSLPKDDYLAAFFLRRRSFSVVRHWARKNEIKTAKQWRKAYHTKTLPSGFPANPDLFYKEWVGWNDFLGNTSFAILAS